MKSITVLLLALLLLGWGGEAMALEIRIRGQSNLEVETRTAGTTLVVEGRLVDDRGVGLPLEAIELVVRARSGALRAGGETDYAGFFSVPVELTPGHVQVSAVFAGGSHLEGARSEAAATLAVEPAGLAVQAPAWVHGTSVEAWLEIRAQAGGNGLPAPVTISVDGRPVETLELDSQGGGRFDVAPFLRGGRQEVGVHLAETAYRRGVSEAVTIQRVDRLRMHGQVDQVVRGAAEGVEVIIALSDGTHPVAGADVAVHLVSEEGGEGEEALLEGGIFTDERGRGALFFGRKELGETTWSVRAEVHPPRGRAVVWDGGAVTFEPNRWVGRLSIVGLVGIFFGLIWLGRQPLWTRWDRLMERWRQAEEEEEVGPPTFATYQEVEFGHLRAERLSRLPARAEEEDLPIWVQVWDSFKKGPVSGASLRLGGAEGEAPPWRADEEGFVELPQDLSGAALEILAGGYVPARARIPLSVGRRALRVELTAVPIQIRKMYRWMLRETGRGDSWGVRTPREIQEDLAHHVGGEAGGDGEVPTWDELLEAITAVVEETNFSGQRYDLEWWERARGLLEAMVEEARRGQ